MTKYLCTEYQKDWLGNYQCKAIAEYIPPDTAFNLFQGLSSLTLDDASLLFVATAKLFATAWVFNRLGFFTRLKH